MRTRKARTPNSPCASEPTTSKLAKNFITAFLSLMFTVTVSSAAKAQSKTFGDWSVSYKEDFGLFASTNASNKRGAEVAKICLAAAGYKCKWFLLNEIKCEQNNEYTLFVNASSGASVAPVKCIIIGGKYLYAFSDSETLELAITKSQLIGVVFPLRNSEIDFYRFSLDGAEDAIKVLDTLVLIKKNE